MAATNVWVSNGNVNLSTASNGYQAEAFNLAGYVTGVLSITTTQARVINTTFANAGNCKGVIIGLTNVLTTVTTMRGVAARLQETKGTCTITIASPGVVTNTGHGLVAGDEISFSTTGALPTGITTSLVYYVIATGLTADTFQFAATVGGAAINTSGTQSGTHTLWLTRATKALTGNAIVNSIARPHGTYYVPFEFATPFAVDTTASKWRFHFLGDAVGTNNWNSITSDATNLFYVAWCDTALSFANNMAVVIKDQVTIDTSATFLGSTANNTGDATNSTAGVICKSLTPTPDNVANLRWASAPAAAYTLTINGNMIVGKHSGFRIGTAASPIPAAQMATVSVVAPTSGSTTGWKVFGASTSGISASGMSLHIYGEIPAVQRTTLNGDAAIGQATIVTAAATGWANGDIVLIGKQDTKAQGSLLEHVVNTCVGTTITLTANLATAIRKSGATVFRANGYGVKWQGYTASALPIWATAPPSNFVISGCEIVDFMFGLGSVAHMSFDDAANRSQFLVQDCSARSTSTSMSRLHNSFQTPIDGAVWRRVNTFRANLAPAFSGVAASGLVPGSVTIDDCRCLSVAAIMGTTSNSILVPQYYSNTSFENCNTSGFVTLTGIGSTQTNVNYWGSGALGSSSVAALCFGTLIKARLSGNTYNQNVLSQILLAAVTSDVIEADSSFNNETANTTDVDFVTGAYVDYLHRSPTGNVNVATSNLTNTIEGSMFKISSYNDTTDDDRVWLTYGRFQRTKSTLSDTTVRTAGGSALRLEHVDDGSGTFPLEWSQVVPTSNIQNKTMTISVWVYINSTAYDASTYTMPTLTVNYDDGTEISAVATATFGSWQQLAVTFTPATTFGRVTVTISGATVATGSDAYFYMDDFNVAFPAGVSLDLGSLDLWAGALPITPTIATFPSLGGVWDEPTSAHTIAGSFGAKEADDLTLDDFIGLK